MRKLTRKEDATRQAELVANAIGERIEFDAPSFFSFADCTDELQNYTYWEETVQVLGENRALDLAKKGFEEARD